LLFVVVDEADADVVVQDDYTGLYCATAMTTVVADTASAKVMRQLLMILSI